MLRMSICVRIENCALLIFVISFFILLCLFIFLYFVLLLSGWLKVGSRRCDVNPFVRFCFYEWNTVIIWMGWLASCLLCHAVVSLYQIPNTDRPTNPLDKPTNKVVFALFLFILLFGLNSSQLISPNSHSFSLSLVHSSFISHGTYRLLVVLLVSRPQRRRRHRCCWIVWMCDDNLILFHFLRRNKLLLLL